MVKLAMNNSIFVIRFLREVSFKNAQVTLLTYRWFQNSNLG